jgi:hypothetical protein
MAKAKLVWCKRKISGNRQKSGFQYLQISRLETKSESVVGDDILYLHPTSEYNVHFPVQRGEVNLTPLVGNLDEEMYFFTYSFVSHKIWPQVGS